MMVCASKPPSPVISGTSWNWAERTRAIRVGILNNCWASLQATRLLSSSAVTATSMSASSAPASRKTVGRIALRGPGAGGPATASAVVADLLAIARGEGSTWDPLPEAGWATTVGDDLDVERAWLLVPSPGEVPAAAGAIGDQQAALVGQTCFAPGEVKCTYGTGAFLLANTGERVVESTHGLIPTVGYHLAGHPPVYALEGSIAVTGSLVQWLRDGLGMIPTAPQIETLARTVEDNGGCYIVPAFSGLYAPHWRTDARGVIVGLTSYVGRGHLARAVLEATGWQTRDVVEAMIADSGIALTGLKVDGGMTANHLLMQFVADVLDVPVERPLVSETVSLGAAYAAGLAVGYWADLEGLRRNWHRAARWEPTIDPARRDREAGHWADAVQRALGWDTR